MTAENPHAGGNAVVLDIGGDVGALIVTMPAGMIELEVEIIPAALVPRPAPDGSVVPSLVFGEFVEGSYDFYVRPDGPIRLTTDVRGGEVTPASWPAGVTV